MWTFLVYVSVQPLRFRHISVISYWMRRNCGNLIIPHGTFGLWIHLSFEGAAFLLCISLYLQRVKEWIWIHDFWVLQGIQADRTIRTRPQACISQGSPTSLLCLAGNLHNIYQAIFPPCMELQKRVILISAHFCSRAAATKPPLLPPVLSKATGAVAMIYKFNKASLNKHLL